MSSIGIRPPVSEFTIELAADIQDAIRRGGAMTIAELHDHLGAPLHDLHPAARLLILRRKTHYIVRSSGKIHERMR